MSVHSGVRWAWRRLRRLSDTDGIAITEYGMLIALIALALIAVLSVFAPGISGWFASKTSAITTN